MTSKARKLIIIHLPYLLISLMGTKLGLGWRMAEGVDFSDKVFNLIRNVGIAFQTTMPSFHPFDLCVGLVVGAAIRMAVYMRGKNAKKFRKGIEHGSARWEA